MIIKKATKKSLSKINGFDENGKHYWLASEYAILLGYKSLSALMPSMKKAMKSCLSLDISINDNFIESTETRKKDYKLTKFACFLISLHADARKLMVKDIKTFFNKELSSYNINLLEDEYIDRIIANETLGRLQIELNKKAKASKVTDHSYFTNAGYQGLYKMTASQLKAYRSLNKEDLSDQMSLTELFANMLRVKITTDNLKSSKIRSEKMAATEHENVGRLIRTLIKRSTGNYPENLTKKPNLELLKHKFKSLLRTYNNSFENQLV